MNSKLNQQLALEQEQVALGVTRYNNQVDGKAVTETRPGQVLLDRTIAPFAEAVRGTLEAFAAGKAGRGRPSKMVKYLGGFDPAVVAYVTARVCLNEAIQSKRVSTVAMSIATLLDEHLTFTEFHAAQPDLFTHFQRKIAKSTSGRHTRAVMNHASKLVDEAAGLPWADSDKLHVGMKLVEMFIENTGLAEIRETRRGKRSAVLLVVTPATLEWLQKSHVAAALAAPLFMPMVVRPDDWTNPVDGGYLMRREMKSRLLKVRKQATLDEYFNTDMPEVYAAVNSLQATPWRINKSVYGVLREIMDSESSLGGLPQGKPQELPARPDALPGFEVALGDMTKEQRDMLREWKAAAATVYEANVSEASKRGALAQQMFVAEKFLAESEFYFPYQLDFRGRIYAVPNMLNPQVDNVGKGLLEFAVGKPLGSSGGYWLAVHLANEFGFDKATLDERVQWVVDNEDAILDSAMRPLDGERFWTTADGGKNSWTALAACFEWAGFRMTGNDYVSHLPVAMDGSCSGLQHYSAMLLDPIGGEAVNLLPIDGAKADIYSRVAAMVQTLVDASDNEYAPAWAGRVIRNIVKQPCMTYAYSATVFGMRDQIRDALRIEEAKSMRTTGKPFIDADHFKAANFLAPIVRRAIEQTVRAAAAAMGWLQAAARATSKENRPLHWTSAVGLPVWQDRRKTKGEEVMVIFQGRRMKLILAADTKDVDGRRQGSSIAPNYVHSQDAAHLMKTVNACVDRGIVDFAMIHDSFGCHACDVDELNLVIRETFIDMYQADRLAMFAEEVQEQLEEEVLPPPPVRGSLDLDRVADSDFFFA